MLKKPSKVNVHPDEQINLLAKGAQRAGDALKTAVGYGFDLISRRHQSQITMQVNTQNRTIHQCARDGNVKSLNALFQHLGDRKKKLISQLDENLMAPIHYAARYNHYKILEVLIKNGADVNQKGDDDQTPLHFAAKYKKIKVIAPVSLRRANSDPNLLKRSVKEDEPKIQSPTRMKYSSTAVNFSPLTDTVVIKSSVSIKPSVSEDKNLHSTATTTQARRGSYQDAIEIPKQAPSDASVGGNFDKCSVQSVISLLVRNGANLNAKDRYGCTPLHYAAMRANSTALTDLLCQAGIMIEAADAQRMRALHLAATHSNIECVRLLLLRGACIDCFDADNFTPLHKAASEGNDEVVKMLLADTEKRLGKASVQKMLGYRDKDGNTALHLAVQSGKFKVVKSLIANNSDPGYVNLTRNKSVTPLHLAASSKKISIVKILVENGARIDQQDSDQTTPLHRAAAINNREAITYLAQRGGNIELANKDNFTPLLIAASYGHTQSLQVLLELGANISVTDKTDLTAVHWACQENHIDVLQALLNHKDGKRLLHENDHYGHQPLHVACEKGHTECAKLLLENGANIGDKTDEDQTPLHLAAEYGREAICKILLEHDRAIVNDCDENSNTPLHLAAIKGHVEVAKVLLQYAADIIARNCNMWAPIDCAAANGKVDVINLLLEYDSPIDPTDRIHSTPLHLAASRGHSDCVKFLISNGANLRTRTSDGYNCLDLAIDNGHREVVTDILRCDKWWDAMRHAYIDKTGRRVTPLRKLIQKMPELAEQVFHKCTTANDVSLDSQNFTVTFNYELLDDQYAVWDLEDSNNGADNSPHHHEQIYRDDQSIKESAKAYSSSRSVIKANHPLHIMVKSEREDLLAHPLVTSLLNHKWDALGRTFYYLNLIIHVIYTVFLTGFALVLQSPYSVLTNKYSKSLTPPFPFVNCTDQQALAQNLSYTDVEKNLQLAFIDVGVWIVIVVVCMKILSELFQMVNARLSYISWENGMEWILYILSLLFVIPFKPNCREFRELWQWQLGALAVFLAWIELILFIRKLSRFGIYVVMFTHIFKTFLQFFPVFFLFVIGFAISFYMILSNQTPFRSVEASLLKTVVMLLGEYDYDGAYNGQQSGVYLLYPESAYILVTIFIIVMSILVMNLLVGLAVDDIKGVQNQAVLTRMAMQVEFALTVESALPEFITKRRILRQLRVKPNLRLRRYISEWCGTKGVVISSGVNTSRISSVLHPQMSEVSKVMAEQEHIRLQIDKLTKQTEELLSHQKKLQDMLHEAMIRPSNN